MARRRAVAVSLWRTIVAIIVARRGTVGMWRRRAVWPRAPTVSGWGICMRRRRAVGSRAPVSGGWGAVCVGGAGDQAVPNRQEPPHHTHMRLRPAPAQAAVARVVPS